MSIDLSLAASIRLEALQNARDCCRLVRADILASARVPDTPLVSFYLLGASHVEERINLLIAAVEAIWKEELDAITADTGDADAGDHAG